MKCVPKIIRKSNGETLLSLGDTFKTEQAVAVYVLAQQLLVNSVLKKDTAVCVGALVGHRGRYVVGLGILTPTIAEFSMEDFKKYFTHNLDYFPPRGFVGDTSLTINYFLPIHKMLQYRYHTALRPWQHRPGFRTG